MDKKIMLLSCFVNVDGLTLEAANEKTYKVSKTLQEEYQNDEFDIRCIVLPVEKQPTEIKCIYPKYIGNNENFFKWFDSFILYIENDYSLIDSNGSPITKNGLDKLINEYKNLRNDFDDTGNLDMVNILDKLEDIKDMLNENKQIEENK